jgi:voltage-gated potassium channel
MADRGSTDITDSPPMQIGNGRRHRISEATTKIIRVTAILFVTYMLVALVIYWIEAGEDGALIKSYPQALWYTLVTVTTVGYGDLYPVTYLGKLAAGLMIIASVGLLGFVIGKFGEYAVENNRRKFLGMDGTDFTGHYLVIGWNDLARTVIKEMIVAGVRVAVLTQEEKDIAEMRSVFTDPQMFFVSFGLYQDDAALERLNIAKAAGAVLLTGDDTTTLVTVLQLRQLNPALKITAYIVNSQLRKTVENAGVSYVISPNEVLGRLIASAAFEPDVSSFMEAILSATTADDDMDLQEFRLVAGHPLVGTSCSEANNILVERAGSQLVSYSRLRNGAWEVVRGHVTHDILQADDYLIVLANKSSAARTASFLGVKQGRMV